MSMCLAKTELDRVKHKDNKLKDKLRQVCDDQPRVETIQYGGGLGGWGRHQGQVCGGQVVQDDGHEEVGHLQVHQHEVHRGGTPSSDFRTCSTTK